MDANPQAVSVGVGIAASAVLWWLFRGKVAPETGPSRPSSNPSSYLTPVAKITKLYVYPVKSCHRIEVDSTDCFKRGLKYDRCWVIIDKKGSFCNARRIPILPQIQPELTVLDDGLVQLTLNAPGMDKLVLTEPKEGTEASVIKIWSLSGEGTDMGDEAGRWLSQFLKMDGCRLYYMSPNNKPRVLSDDNHWDDIILPEDETSFADWSPILIISEASLELLNSKLDDALVIERFRPNIVVSGCLPHAEDTWGAIKVGDHNILRGLKPCIRCKMTRVDPEKGNFTGNEPIATLKKYRLHETVFPNQRDPRFGVSPLFGYNYTVLQPGRVNVGDTVFTQM